MKFNNFYLQVAIRILLLLAAGTLIMYSLWQRHFFSTIVAVILFISILYEWIKYIRGIEKAISLFIRAVTEKETEIYFRENKYGAPFSVLFWSFGKMVEAQKDARTQQEILHSLLMTVLDKTPFGIIVIPRLALSHEEEEILFLNQGAEKILGIPRFPSWKRLRMHLSSFAEKIGELSDGGKAFLQLPDNRQLSIEVQVIFSQNKPLLLISFQDIKTEMEQKETDAWNKLIQVMTHEILNSLTPIHTMSYLLQQITRKPVLSEEDKTDLQTGSRTIYNRSEGLMRFVKDYRKVAELPVPMKTNFPVKEILQDIGKMFQSQAASMGVHLHIHSVSEHETLFADRKLIEQALINLLTNSLHAVAHAVEPLVALSFLREGNKRFFQVKDNGKGISPEEQTQVFVPFFTTRADGSGIGLSVVRNIMRLHKGNITVFSAGKDKGAVFRLIF